MATFIRPQTELTRLGFPHTTAEHIMLSQCCGARPMGFAWVFCSKCRDTAVFECDCGVLA